MIPANLFPLANHLWQSTLFAAAAWLLTVALRKNRAAVRYRLWLAASVKFLVPFSLLIGTGSHFAWRTSLEIAPAPLSRAMEQLSQPFELPANALPAAARTSPSNPVPAILFSVWFCGFAISTAVWFVWWLRFCAAIRTATPLP